MATHPSATTVTTAWISRWMDHCSQLRRLRINPTAFRATAACSAITKPAFGTTTVASATSTPANLSAETGDCTPWLIKFLLGPDHSISRMPYFFTAALVTRGIFPSRPVDIIGLGVVYGHFSNDLQNFQRRAQQLDPNVGVQSHETVA